MTPAETAQPVLLSGPHFILLLVLLAALAAVLVLWWLPEREEQMDREQRVWTRDNSVPSRQSSR